MYEQIDPDNISAAIKAKNNQFQTNLERSVINLLGAAALSNFTKNTNHLKKQGTEKDEEKKANIYIENLQQEAEKLKNCINNLVEKSKIAYFLGCIPYNELDEKQVNIIQERAGWLEKLQKHNFYLEIEGKNENKKLKFNIEEFKNNLASFKIHHVDWKTLMARRVMLIIGIILLLAIAIGVGLFLGSPAVSISALGAGFITSLTAIPGFFCIGSPATETMNTSAYGMDIKTQIPVPMTALPFFGAFLAVIFNRSRLASWTTSPPVQTGARTLDFATFKYHAKALKLAIHLDNEVNKDKKDKLLFAISEAERIYTSGMRSVFEMNYQDGAKKGLDILLAVTTVYHSQEIMEKEDIFNEQFTFRAGQEKEQVNTTLSNIINRKRNPALDSLRFWRKKDTEASIRYQSKFTPEAAN